jgi:hypothetical protein
VGRTQENYTDSMRRNKKNLRSVKRCARMKRIRNSERGRELELYSIEDKKVRKSIVVRTS